MEGMNEASVGTGEGPDLEEERDGRVRARRRALVAALCSGSYRQTRKWLATEEGFCCLGVACEVAIAGGMNMVKQKRGGDPGYLTQSVRFFYHPADVLGGHERVLPTSVARWFGFGDVNPRLRMPPHLVVKYAGRYTAQHERLEKVYVHCKEFAASALNDDLGLSMADIGECFQYTFLREDWEVEHAKAAG